MREPIDEQLRRRREVLQPVRRFPGLRGSLALHVAAVLLFVVAPRLFGQAPEPIEYVAVQILPLQALGERRARPAPAPEPQARPEPAAVEPEPEPEPEPAPEPEPPPVASPEPRPDPAPAPPAPRPEPSRPAAPPAAPAAPTAPEEPADDDRPIGTPGSAEGHSRGTSPLGTTIAGLDNPDFTYGYYLDRMLALIDELWRPPVVGQRLQAIVHFRVDREGRVSEVELRQSSGNASFDLAGMRAVQAAAPLPPLPAGYPHATLGVNLILH